MVALVSTQLLYGIGDGVTQSNLRPSSPRRRIAAMAGPSGTHLLAVWIEMAPLHYSMTHLWTEYSFTPIG